MSEPTTAAGRALARALAGLTLGGDGFVGMADVEATIKRIEQEAAERAARPAPPLPTDADLDSIARELVSALDGTEHGPHVDDPTCSRCLRPHDAALATPADDE